jgi:hypothetical protein
MIDPNSLLLTALTVGGGFVATQAASEAVKDAYRALRDRIKSRFADQPAAPLVLDEYSADPSTWEKPLRKLLTDTGADQDQELLALARRIMQEADPKQTALGKYNIQVAGQVQQMNVGEHQQVTASFGQPAPTGDKERKEKPEDNQ